MSELKKQLRPVISSITETKYSNREEKFQNEVLRPIIKLQHKLIIRLFEHFLTLNRLKFNDLDKTKRAKAIQNLFKVDLRLKIELRGLIIGLFTFEEYEEYLDYSSPLNKRMYTMMQQRVESVYLKE